MKKYPFQFYFIYLLLVHMRCPAVFQSLCRMHFAIFKASLFTGSYVFPDLMEQSRQQLTNTQCRQREEDMGNKGVRRRKNNSALQLATHFDSPSVCGLFLTLIPFCSAHYLHIKHCISHVGHFKTRQFAVCSISDPKL